MPPVLNIIALATFAASLSTRALDPVLPHVASDFGVSIAAAAGFASVFAFTFAIVQPVLGAAADLFGKARLVIVCLVLLGLANILGALSSSFSLLFASRILAGIGAGGVFPIALGLTSDLVAPNRRQVAIGRTLAGSMTGNLLGASVSGLIGDFLGWRGVLAVLGALAVVASVAVAIGFRGGALKRAPAKVDLSVLRHGYRTIFGNPNARVCYTAVFIEGCCVLGLFPYVASFLFEQGVTSLSIGGLVIAGFAVGGLFYTLSVSRLLPRLGVNGMMTSGGRADGPATRNRSLRPTLAAAGRQLHPDGVGLLHAARLAAGVRQRTVGASPRHRAVIALVLLFHGPDRRPCRLWVWHPERRKDTGLADQRGHHRRTGLCLRLAVAAGQAGGCRRAARRPALTPLRKNPMNVLRPIYVSSKPSAFLALGWLPCHFDGKAFCNQQACSGE